MHFGLDYPISATNVIILGDSAERNIHRRQFGFIFDPLPLSDTDLANHKGSFCFQHLLISGASWAYADSRTRPISPLMFGLLRKHIRDRFEITDSDYLPPSSRSSAEPAAAAAAALNVRVPTKDLATAEHGSYISNIPQIFNYIENTYPQAQRLETFTLSNMTAQEIVRAYSTTHVMIAQPASDIMMAFLLPDFATLCVVNRFIEGKLRRSNEIAIWLRFLPHVSVQDMGDESWADPENPQFATLVPIQPQLNDACLADAFSRWTQITAN